MRDPIPGCRHLLALISAGLAWSGDDSPIQADEDVVFFPTLARLSVRLGRGDLGPRGSSRCRRAGGGDDTPERFAAALGDPPAERWQVFNDPQELSEP